MLRACTFYLLTSKHGDLLRALVLLFVHLLFVWSYVVGLYFISLAFEAVSPMGLASQVFRKEELEISLNGSQIS